MINVFTSGEIRAIEKEAIKGGLTEDELIGRAAKKLYEAVGGMTFDRALVFAGGGNNGSDALSLAAMLIAAGRKTEVYLCSDRPNAFVSARIDDLRDKSAEIKSTMSAEVSINRGDLVVDGIFGIGLSRNVEGKIAETIGKINASGAKVLSIDIPSGLNADTGRVMGRAVEADVTVTFSAMKQGLLLADGRNYCGRIIVADIGLALPDAAVKVTEAEDIGLPRRLPVTNKGTYGNVKIIAGSPTMIGASLLAHESALASLRSGTGYAMLCVPDSLKSIYQSRVKEELLCFMPDIAGKIIFDSAVIDQITVKASSIVIGMGLGRNPDVIKMIEYLARRFEGTLVIDGDGLNALAENLSAVAGHVCKLILTPHVLEFQRLSKDRGALPDTERTRLLAEKLDAVVAMKSATTVISEGKATYLNVTGTPAMAKAGSGDVLAGMIGAFACGSDPLTATLRACYEFGKAGERAALERGETSVLASDIIINI